jgi:hypothetical protein
MVNLKSAKYHCYHSFLNTPYILIVYYWLRCKGGKTEILHQNRSLHFATILVIVFFIFNCCAEGCISTFEF